MNNEIETKFYNYTNKKYFWILIFVLFAFLTSLFGIIILFYNLEITKIIFSVCLIIFIFSIFCLFKYEPKNLFLKFNDNDKLFKSLNLCKKYAENIINNKSNKIKTILESILYHEIIYINEVFFLKFERQYDFHVKDKNFELKKDFLFKSASFYSKHITGFCSSPNKFIEFSKNFEDVYSKISSEKYTESDVERFILNYTDFLYNFKVEASSTKNIVNLIGNNWHKIILFVVILIFLISILDVTFELGFKLDRYLAVGSAIPTIYLIKNYNPFKHYN